MRWRSAEPIGASTHHWHLSNRHYPPPVLLHRLLFLVLKGVPLWANSNFSIKFFHALIYDYVQFHVDQVSSEPRVHSVREHFPASQPPQFCVALAWPIIMTKGHLDRI